MGLNWAEHTVEIEAPIETCFEAITDYESFPAWQSAVVSTEVIDRHKDGLGKNVKLVVDAKVRKVDYTLDYSYDRPDRIEWDFVEGNGINDADGHYLFESLGDDRTRATYKFGLEVGIPLPGIVARRAHKQTLKASVEDLKREAERRATASEGSKAASPKGLAGFGRRKPPEDPPPTVERPIEAPAESQAGLIPRDLVGVLTLPRELAGRAISIGRGATEGAARAGIGIVRGATETGIGAATSMMNRIARVLGDNESDRD
jgi:uncharacterized membrane protein